VLFPAGDVFVTLALPCLTDNAFILAEGRQLQQRERPMGVYGTRRGDMASPVG